MDKPTKKRRFLGKSDLYLIIGLLAAAVLFFAIRVISAPSGDTEAIVVLDGYIVDTVRLTRNRTFSVHDKPKVVFEVRDGAIAFMDSNCPDKICVHTGFISKPGQAAVCLPNNMMVQITAKGETGADDADVVAN